MIQNEKRNITNICTDHLRVFEFDTGDAEKIQTKRIWNVYKH